MKDKNSKTKKEKKEKPEQNKNPYDEFDGMNLENKNKFWNMGILAFLGLFCLLCIYLQYQNEKQRRRSVVTDDGETDYYGILGVSYGADLQEIRLKYKDLAKIWHPDKNVNCKTCQDKFAQISKAYEILSDEAKKGEYDTKGGKSNFKSSAILTDKNYHHLVEESNDYWVILVYENTRGNRFNQFVTEVWEEVASRYKHTVRFGVINILQGENILHFLPYKFQYYPNIFTFLHGEASELFQNLEEFNVKTFTSFVESSFVTKVNLIDTASLSGIVSSQSVKKEVTSLIRYEDLDVNIFVLSPKNYIDLVVKDFDKNYNHVFKIYQNDLGFYAQFSEVLKSQGKLRVFALYNDIVINNDKITLERVLKPIPVEFGQNALPSPKLQFSFNIAKSLALQYIYKNSYTKHCINKIIIGGEEEEKKDGESEINLCVIVLDHKNNFDDAVTNATILQLLTHNFNKKISQVSKKVKKEGDHEININYGTTSLESNKDLLELFNKFSVEKNFKVSEKSKLFMIINDTQEKFTFKSFKDAESIKDYFEELDNADNFEDISFSFEYFANYSVREVKELFNEEKVFSLEKIISKAFFAHMQPFYFLSIILIIVANNFYLNKKYLSRSVITGSIVLHMLWEIFNSLNI